MTFNLVKHLRHAFAFSEKTFGPHDPNDPVASTAGVIDHIEKEVVEVKKDPSDLDEWIDILILGCDGAMRAGYTPNQIVHAWEQK